MSNFNTTMIKPVPADADTIEASVEGFETVPAVPTVAPVQPVETPKPEPVPVPVPSIPEPKAPDPVPEPQPVGDWPADAKTNREAWLSEAARRLAMDSFAGVLFSVGFGKGGTRGAKEWSVIDNAQGGGRQVFVRPSVDNKTDAAQAVALALQSVGIETGSVIMAIWPDYPQPDVTHSAEKSITRLLKCKCGACGYTVRVTKRWLDRSGTPLCPHAEHRGRAMEVAQ